MKTPRPTKNAERGAAEQGKREFTGNSPLALASTAIQNAALRFWFATPSRWRRGTIHTKAKAPVCDDTFGQAVATPTDKRGFAMPKLWGLVRLHLSQAVYGHGGGYPQGRPHGLSRVFNHHAHPLRVKTHRVVLKSRQGATTMSASPMASRCAAPTSPAFDPVRLHGDAINSIALAGFYARRGNHIAAARKATLAMVSLRKLAAFERAEVAA